MEDILVYISGEDLVTKTIIERILTYCSPRFKVFKEMPARGGQIKHKISELNRLSRSKPVILLTDLDVTQCPPMLKTSLLANQEQNDDFILNIAVDEAEAWLMADREGFAEYFGIPISEIPNAVPQKMGGRKPLTEMEFPCKSSWMFTHILISKSSKDELKRQIEAQGTATKGKEYNPAVVPFIKNAWSIDAAMPNSDSLTRMVKRLQALEEKYPL